jgi:putative nucleotidyltransferase with HDIG domain
MQATALGASRVVLAGTPPTQVFGELSQCLPSRGVPDAGLPAHAVAARSVLTRLFALGRQGKSSTPPALVEAGAGDVEHAVAQAGVRAWLDVVWQFDDATHQHCLLVAGLAAGFARQLGFSHIDSRRLTGAALLHDVGKSRVPLHILNKPGPLTPDEQRVMRTHPMAGVTLLAGGGFSSDLLAVVRSHHEYLDGSGYPDGLRGCEIPDLVRLVTVCDIFAALIERRTYRATTSAREAYAVLTGMGGRLDRDLVNAFRPLAMAAGVAGSTLAT